MGTAALLPLDNRRGARAAAAAGGLCWVPGPGLRVVCSLVLSPKDQTIPAGLKVEAGGLNISGPSMASVPML